MGSTGRSTGTGITVNTVSPGPIETPMSEQILHELAKTRGWSEGATKSELQAAKELMPTLEGRFGKPEEVAELVAFVASPLAEFINGANLRIDGGRVACIN